jgi:hypothetical protein
VCGQPGGSTGARNQTLGALLWLAIEQSRLPLKLFDSCAGFLLADGSVRSPARQHRADRALAGVERGRTGWFPAPLPRSGGGAGRLNGEWNQFGLAIAAAKSHGGGVEGRANRNSPISPGVHRSGTAGGGPRVSVPGDRSASDLGGLRAISTAAPSAG